MSATVPLIAPSSKPYGSVGHSSDVSDTLWIDKYKDLEERHIESIVPAVESVEWAHYPPIPEDEDELWMRTCVEIRGLSNISTKESSADLRVQVVTYWQDERLAQAGKVWPRHQPLPVHLWGPVWRVKNGKV